MNSNTPALTASMAAAALCACGAGLGGSSETAIAPDAVTLAAFDSRARGGEHRGPTLVCDRKVDDFATSPDGKFPAEWETWRDADLEHAVRDQAFVVVREREQALLRVRPATRELSIGRGVDRWDLQAYPILEWRWRLSSPPPDTTPESEDQPLARVGAVWLTGLPFIVRRIEYTWNRTRPLAAQESARFGQDRTIVVAASESASGQWHTVRVDLRRHYRALFSSEPSAPAGIAVSARKSGPGIQSVMDYRDFRLCRYAVEQP